MLEFLTYSVLFPASKVIALFSRIGEWLVVKTSHDLAVALRLKEARIVPLP